MQSPSMSMLSSFQTIGIGISPPHHFGELTGFAIATKRLIFLASVSDFCSFTVAAIRLLVPTDQSNKR